MEEKCLYIKRLIRWSILYLALYFAGLNSALGGTVVSVNDIQSRSMDANTTELKLLFENNNSAVRYLILKHPTRIVVDIQNGQLKNTIDLSTLLANMPITSIRQGNQPNQVLRLVFDLKPDVSVMPSASSDTNILAFKLKTKVSPATAELPATVQTAAKPPATVVINDIQTQMVDARTTDLKLILGSNKDALQYFTLEYFTLENPTRLVVDIKNGQLKDRIDTGLLPANTPITSVRQGSQPNQVLRLVFDLNSNVSVAPPDITLNTVVFQLKSQPLPSTEPLPIADSASNTNNITNAADADKKDTSLPAVNNAADADKKDTSLPAVNTEPSPTPVQNAHSKAPFNSQFALQQDSMLGPVGQVKSALSLTENQAAALELDGGARVVRVNGTYGFALNDTNRVKLTAEYLLEDLDFNFYTGDTRQWVDQGALGASYQYLLGNDTLQSLEIGGHYSHAPSKNLSDKVIAYDDGSTLTNYRRIAGGDDWNGTAEANFHLWPQSLLSVGGDYDRVRYDTEYSHQDGHDAQGLGGHVRLQQLLNSKSQLNLDSTLSQLYNTYNAGLNWILSSTSKTSLSAGLNSSYTSDHTTERNFWINGINLFVTWDPPQNKEDKPHYTEPQIAAQDLATWTQTPAVRMPDVLAISDERIVNSNGVTPFTPLTGICPSMVELIYDPGTKMYSAPGGWVQSYPQGQIDPPSPFPVTFDSANVLGNPSGSIACLYNQHGATSSQLILENSLYNNAIDTGTNWLQNAPSQLWPSTEPSPNFTCRTVNTECIFTTVAG